MKNIIKKIREEKGLTQNEMSAICGIGRQTLYDLETYTRKSINEGILEGLEQLGVNADEVEETYQYQRQQHKEELLQNLK